MGKQLYARTEWEIDAARRREVIEDAFGARNLLRASSDDEAEMVAARQQRGPLSTLKAIFNSQATKPDDVPCDHSGAMTPVKPGA